MTSLHERPYYAVAVASLFTLAVFAPTLLGRSDSFPLSTYPMFAQHRGQPTMVRLSAVSSAGTSPIRPELLGTGEVLQAKVLLEQVARRPSAQRRKFCAQTAERLAPLDEAANWEELVLVRAQFDPIDYFYNGGEPVSEKILTRCSVRGETPPAEEYSR